MAVITPRPHPPAVLRQELQDARAAGIDWEQAWSQATARSLRDVDREDQNGWRDVYAWTNEFWRAAYLGERWDCCDRPLYPG